MTLCLLFLQDFGVR